MRANSTTYWHFVYDILKLDAILESWNIFANRSLFPSLELNEKLLTQHFTAHNSSDTATSSFKEKTAMGRKRVTLDFSSYFQNKEELSTQFSLKEIISFSRNHRIKSDLNLNTPRFRTFRKNVTSLHTACCCISIRIRKILR